MAIRRGSAKQKDGIRRAWLAAQTREVLAALPGLNDDVTDAARVALDTLCARMFTLGLFGKTAPAGRQRETVRRLLSEFRGTNKDVGW